MKYILISIVALILSIGIPCLVVFLINRKYKLKAWVNAVIIVPSSLALLLSSVLIYLSVYYGATNEAKAYLEGDASVSVTYERGAYHFDYQESDETAVIFYGGAKVEATAYAPICSEVAHLGVDVYLMDLPFRFALLGMNSADEIAKLGRHESLYMMGHSLGGTVASQYLAKTSYSFKGIIFLASYPSKKIDDSLKALSLYGSNDLVLNKDAYEKAKPLLPKDYKEVVIEGGNHGDFGDYGFQDGDGESSIGKKAQLERAKTEIQSFLFED